MRRILLLLFMVVTLGASAQDSLSIRFGYLSYEQALQSMPEYKAARENTDKLWGQYEAELKRVHGLPEGAIALYPEEVYQEMRAREIGNLQQLGTSFALRRSLRRFGALTQMDTITRQGRVTLPAAFREHAGIAPGKEVCIVGVEVGVEIWEAGRFAEEMRAINQHLDDRREAEMARELQMERGNS